MNVNETYSSKMEKTASVKSLGKKHVEGKSNNVAATVCNLCLH